MATALAQRPRARSCWTARPGVLGHARPGHARRRRRRAGRGLVRARHPGRAARDPRGRRALPGPGRRMGGAAHRHGDRAGGALRRRGRRVPDPRPQRLRRARVRLVGARDRGRALRVPRRRVAPAVDARAAAAAPMAQARRGHAGGRADGRGRRGPAPGAHAGPAPRGARAAGGFDGRVHVVAVAPPGRRPARAGCAPASRVAVTVLALLLVWAALVAPNQPADFNVAAFLRLPLELLVVVAAGRPAARRPRAACWSSCSGRS